jgi:hypothetical protein
VADADSIDMERLYEVVARIARARETITYEKLSLAFKNHTGISIHRSQWGGPLGNLSRRCSDAGLPPISTVVVSIDGLPGYRYWGIPGAPKTKDLEAWRAVCRKVHAVSWPATLPGPAIGARPPRSPAAHR